MGLSTLQPPAIGERFGIMTVLAVHERHTANSLTKWKLKCDCGNETVSTAGDLRHGRRVSCGCLRYRGPDGHDGISTQGAGQAFGMLRQNAERRGLPVELTREHFDWLRDQPCVYCGAPGPNGVDRVESTQGYTLENVVPSCKKCNLRKGAVHFDELLAWMRRVIQHTGGEPPKPPLSKGAAK